MGLGVEKKGKEIEKRFEGRKKVIEKIFEGERKEKRGANRVEERDL